uniref:Uncharacterized protein n=1 Tax=Rhizophora mucronata TaxID=61149 RepID=A0A2P2IZE0_RHIMU
MKMPNATELLRSLRTYNPMPMMAYDDRKNSRG